MNDYNCVAMAMQTVSPHALLVGTYAGRAFWATPVLAPPSPEERPQLAIGLYPGLVLRGRVGIRCELQYSTDLGESKTWHNLADIVLPSSPFLYFDAVSATEGRRFYRAIVKP